MTISVIFPLDIVENLKDRREAQFWSSLGQFEFADGREFFDWILSMCNSLLTQHIILSASARLPHFAMWWRRRDIIQSVGEPGALRFAMRPEFGRSSPGD